MISEQVVVNNDGEKIVTIRSDANNFEVTSIYNKDGILVEQWVYERNKYYTTCSAQYDSNGRLKSKHLFNYDVGDALCEYVIYDDSGVVTRRFEYDNDKKGRAVFVKKFDGGGDLLCTIENAWSDYVCVKSTCRDKEGIEIEEPNDDALYRKTGGKPGQI